MAMTQNRTTIRTRTTDAAKVVTSTISVESEHAPEFVDITSHVRQCVESSGIANGFAVIFSRHTTASVRINENEPLLLQDMEAFLERIGPKNDPYKHNDFTIRTVNMTEDECPNGHAHCQHLVLGTSECIPIVDSKLQLGKWQSVFFIELDRPRPREVFIQIVGA
jgi:secondary thiamine-phosphate synthase enzyme